MATARLHCHLLHHSPVGGVLATSSPRPCPCHSHCTRLSPVHHQVVAPLRARSSGAQQQHHLTLFRQAAYMHQVGALLEARILQTAESRPSRPAQDVLCLTLTSGPLWLNRWAQQAPHVTKCHHHPYGLVVTVRCQARSSDGEKEQELPQNVTTMMARLATP
ncbi:hypothetical protein NDU88_005118 [Pleurodeles waltl]|uniref:Uncharacterized protein n=1 Tax=Pleurodeles waltl TaxID=8319 RepID=A0AAV7KZR7_PLEWA|nr:hypothetical protein NDU88_005118 [Pleurodeles waltl]